MVVAAKKFRESKLLIKHNGKLTTAPLSSLPEDLRSIVDKKNIENDNLYSLKVDHSIAIG